MGLRDIGASLPPGFKFYPSDEELVCHYLSKKITNEDALKGTLVEIDLHTCEPWQLPDVAKLNANEWYFFNFRDRKYATGYRTNRATISGYWKATGKDRVVRDPRTKAIVGMRKTLVFHRNRAPNGTKTGWIMHEFRLDSPHMPPKEDWVLCRVFHKSKGDNNDKSQLSLQNNKTSAGATSLEFASFPPIDLAIPSYLPPVLSHFPLTRNPHHHLLNIHEVNPSFIHLSQDQMSNDGIGEIISRFDHDDYNLFNMNFGNGNMPRSLGELRFDNVDDHGNNLVFL